MIIRGISWIFYLLCLFQIAVAAEPLRKSDYFGTWSSNISAVKGETQLLEIKTDMSSYFYRIFEDSKKQSYKTDLSGVIFIEDILILDFRTKNTDLAYKMVLSGWRSQQIKTLYGTLYMYRDGIQFNGIPISFISYIENNN